jgi:hypothetical protein
MAGRDAVKAGAGDSKRAGIPSDLCLVAPGGEKGGAQSRLPVSKRAMADAIYDLELSDRLTDLLGTLAFGQHAQATTEEAKAS